MSDPNDKSIPASDSKATPDQASVGGDAAGHDRGAPRPVNPPVQAADPIDPIDLPDRPELGESQWYYAVGDTRHGPVSLGQLRQQIQAGELLATDLIWREGLPDWRLVSELGDLISRKPTVHVREPAMEPPRIRAREKLQRVTEVAGTGAVAGTLWLREHTGARTWAFVGLVLLLGARGCDSLGQRYVVRLEAKARLTRMVWEDDYQQHRARFEAQLKALTDDSGTRTEREEIQKRLDELNEEQETERRKLESGVWNTLQQAAEQQSDRNAMASYWRQAAALAGLMLLTCSLLFVAVSGPSPDRYAAWAMLAIVLWSAVVDGAIW